MTTILRTLFEKAIKPFVAEHYQYIVPLNSTETINRISTLLNNKGSMREANISGKIKGTNFYAQQRGSLILINNGTEAAVFLNGEVESTTEETTLINLKVDIHPALILPISFAVLLDAFLLYQLVYKTGFWMSANEWKFALVAAIFAGIFTWIGWSTPYYRKRRLRQTFEVNMRIKPLPENLTA